MNKIIFSIVLLISLSAKAADFTVELVPAANSVTDAHIQSVSQSKVTGLSSALSSISSSLSSYLLKSEVKAPVIKKFLSGSTGSPYVPSAGVKYIRVRMVGAGGGGGGSGVGGGNAGAAGQSTTFGTGLLVAGGGNGGSGGGAGGAGGTVSLGGLSGIGIQGGSGGGNFYSRSPQDAGGGQGGSSAFGGAGSGGSVQGGKNGTVGVANSGSGGGGAGFVNVAGAYSGSGGGSGGFIDAIIPAESLLTSYPLYVGNGGAPGQNGAGGINEVAAGSFGGSGLIEVTEYFQ